MKGDTCEISVDYFAEYILIVFYCKKCVFLNMSRNLVPINLYENPFIGNPSLRLSMGNISKSFSLLLIVDHSSPLAGERMKHGTTKTLRVGCILLVLFFLFCAFALLPQPVQAQTVTATVPVGSDPDGVAVTPNGAYAYVANDFGSGSVSVISTATNTVTATITVGNEPDGVAVTPNGEYAYVTN